MAARSPRTTNQHDGSGGAAHPTPPHLARPAQADLTSDAEFAAFQQAAQRGFQEEMPAEAVEFDRTLYEPGRFYGHRVDGRWVSTFGAYSRRITVPGGTALPVAAVTAVTVQAPYRRRGLLTEMMTRQFADAARRGEPVAALFASESGIYGRFGYGQAAPRARLAGRTRSMRFRPEVDAKGGSVDEVTREEYLDLVTDLHDRLRPARPGTLDRPARWWQQRLYDLEFARGGATALRYLVGYDASGRVDGHATYRIKDDYTVTGPNNEVRIGEVEADGAAGYARLWRYLLDLDLARSFLRRNAPVDDPIRHLVADPRAIHTELADGLYLRLLDVPAALRARRYAGDADLVLELTDSLVGANAGRYAVSLGPDGAAVRRVRRRPDIGLDVRELGAVYLGGPSLAELHRAGLVTEHRPGAVAVASTAFGWPVAPFCADDF
jgi:predicted acetyltransferase